MGFMMQKCFTIETRLEKKKFPIEYFIWDMHKQSRLFRIVWKLIQTMNLPEHKLNTHLQHTYDIDKRTANSLIKTAKGHLKAIKELKKVEMNQLSNKIETIKSQITKFNNDITKLKNKVTLNKASKQELIKYRRLKQKIWQKKQRLNRMKQKLQQYQMMIEKDYYAICWGTKKLFKAQYHLKENGFKSHEGWLNAYRRKRDSQINFIGCHSEPCGNQNCQLAYHQENDSFALRIRKDKEATDDKEHKFIVIHDLHFKYQKEKLIEVIHEHKTPLTFRILRRNKKWYVQVIFTWKQKKEEVIRNTQYGTIGLDYNDGFISMSETDYYGNLIALNHFSLKYHGTGNKANSETQEVLAKIVKKAKEREKPIVIEDLDFVKTKSKRTSSYSKKGKQYNKMIHAFDYSRYKERLENACNRNKVALIFVNAAYTSQIGVSKYSNRMKLNRHQAASYVIARKGQGYIDKVIK